VLALFLSVAAAASAPPAEPIECRQDNLPHELLDVVVSQGVTGSPYIIGTVAIRASTQTFVGRCARYVADTNGSYFRFFSGRTYGLEYYSRPIDPTVAYAPDRELGGSPGSASFVTCDAQSPARRRGDEICVTAHDGVYDISVWQYAGLSEITTVRALPDRLFFLGAPDARGGTLTLFYRNAGKPFVYNLGLY
jgi:hypothetical protein